MPRIRSESPAFDLHHPETAHREGQIHNEGPLAAVYGTADTEGRGHGP